MSSISGLAQWPEQVAPSRGIGRRCGLDPALLLWLWCRSAAVAPIQLLAQKLPYATSIAMKKKKKTKKWNFTPIIHLAVFFCTIQASHPWNVINVYTHEELLPLIFFFFGLFRAVPLAYGSSQARGVELEL